jgi:hypothetical protein
MRGKQEVHAQEKDVVQKNQEKAIVTSRQNQGEIQKC